MALPKIRPILMSMPMAIALREGRKTQTRRLIKPRKGEELDPEGIYTYHPGDHELARCPYGKPGDLLWVKETYGIDLDGGTFYRAGDTENDGDDLDNPWKPSIFMPRRLSCMTLEIKEVWVHRLKSISEMDAYAEGIDTEGDAYLAAEHGKLGGASGPAASICAYADLWDSINGAGSWDSNPWVYALKFKVHRKNVDEMTTGSPNG